MPSWLGRRAPLALLLAAGAAAVDGQGAAAGVTQGAAFEAGVRAHSSLPDPALLRREAPVAPPPPAAQPPSSLAEGASAAQTLPDPEMQEQALQTTGTYQVANFSNGTNDTFRSVLPSNITGLMGPKGPPGHIGREGDPGPMGPPGVGGKDGVLVEGEMGLMGLAGKHGPQGPPGEKGPIGPAGPRGPTWDTDRQFKEMLSLTRDFIRRTDTITQVHDQAATMMLGQIRDMEKSLGMYEQEASGAGDMLAELRQERDRMNAEVDAVAAKVKKVAAVASTHEAQTKAVEQKTHEFADSIATTEAPVKSGTSRPLALGVAASLVLAAALGLQL